MAVARQWKNGSWMVHWELNGVMDVKSKPSLTRSASTSTTFTCAGYSYQLNFTDFFTSIDLSLSAPGVPVEHRPTEVTVFLKERMKKLTETSQGTWAPAIWGGGRHFNFPTAENGYCYGDQKPVFQLLLEFNCEKPAKRPKTEGEQHILKHLLKLLDNQSMADITFIVKGEKIKAHSVMISLASPILGAMLKQAKGSESNTLEIEDIDPGVFQHLLRYLYTGDCPELDATEMTEQLFLAADKYEIHLLKGECELSLMSKVTLENVVNRLVMANQHTAPKLLEAAMKCLVHNKDHIWSRPEWMTLGTKHLELVFMASHRMVADQYCGCCGKLNAGTVQNA